MTLPPEKTWHICIALLINVQAQYNSATSKNNYTQLKQAKNNVLHYVVTEKSRTKDENELNL